MNKIILSSILGLLIAYLVFTFFVGSFVPESKIEEYKKCRENLEVCKAQKEIAAKRLSTAAANLMDIISNSAEATKIEHFLLNKANISVGTAIGIIDSLFTSLSRLEISARDIAELQELRQSTMVNKNIIDSLRETISSKKHQLSLLKERLTSMEGNVTPRNLIEEKKIFDPEILALAESTEKIIEESERNLFIEKKDAKKLKTLLKNLTNDNKTLQKVIDSNAVESRNKILKYKAKIDSINFENDSLEDLYEKVSDNLIAAKNAPDISKCEQVKSFMESARKANSMFSKCGKERRAFFAAAEELIGRVKQKDNCDVTLKSIQEEFPACLRYITKNNN
ncbi:MAG: hypothetical protein RIC95_09315 [Vicingaceae bacterium]